MSNDPLFLPQPAEPDHYEQLDIAKTLVIKELRKTEPNKEFIWKHLDHVERMEGSDGYLTPNKDGVTIAQAMSAVRDENPAVPAAKAIVADMTARLKDYMTTENGIDRELNTETHGKNWQERKAAEEATKKHIESYSAKRGGR